MEFIHVLVKNYGNTSTINRMLDTQDGDETYPTYPPYRTGHAKQRMTNDVGVPGISVSTPPVLDIPSARQLILKKSNSTGTRALHKVIERATGDRQEVFILKPLLLAYARQNWEGQMPDVCLAAGLPPTSSHFVEVDSPSQLLVPDLLTSLVSSGEYYSPLVANPHEPPHPQPEPHGDPSGGVRQQVVANNQGSNLYLPVIYSNDSYVTTLMEERLIRWRPPNSQHNVDETFNERHPFQLTQLFLEVDERAGAQSRGSNTQGSMLSGVSGLMGRIAGMVFHTDSTGVDDRETDEVARFEVEEDAATDAVLHPKRVRFNSTTLAPDHAELTEDELVEDEPAAEDTFKRLRLDRFGPFDANTEFNAEAMNYQATINSATSSFRRLNLPTARGVPVLNDEGYLSYAFLEGEDGGGENGPGSKYPQEPELPFQQGGSEGGESCVGCWDGLVLCLCR
ncbi:hypothetical protein BABINDRAFT_168241 [Babjeviella inositovora NRRL Y-12698]|uniref:Uncharacterized protein n=1 Tax=Babjeviella inositovora NRRL Y-12698 TaxID=984486 RepID=A0A1E3QLD2_9ASCO|nr:uncharacterized protein BABINDRAFT_168241 [Babjeviella inositovora NRRL Y-12698]ODQ78506.1 hypothetical protein BABINDRAFT_168241 [Babjeviella inositovora NRRL Y-12698]